MSRTALLAAIGLLAALHLGVLQKFRQRIVHGTARRFCELAEARLVTSRIARTLDE